MCQYPLDSKALFNGAGIVHLDEAANERVYGKPVSPNDILEGRVKPPDSFRKLIDALISAEEGRFERTSTSSDYGGDSDGSTGLRSNRSAPVTPVRSEFTSLDLPPNLKSLLH